MALSGGYKIYWVVPVSALKNIEYFLEPSHNLLLLLHQGQYWYTEMLCTRFVHPPILCESWKLSCLWCWGDARQRGCWGRISIDVYLHPSQAFLKLSHSRPVSGPMFVPARQSEVAPIRNFNNPCWQHACLCSRTIPSILCICRFKYPDNNLTGHER
jgi:hypothetical protein